MSKIKMDAFYGMIDQGLISLSNLGIGLFLINFTSKDSYGLYGIGFAAVLLSVGVANALITTQMLVNANDRQPEKRAGYCCSMLYAQYLIFIPAWLVFELTVMALNYFSLIPSDLLIYLSVTATTILAAVFHEFMRRYFYQSLKPVKVLQIDIINVILIFSCLFIAIFYKLNQLHSWAIGIYGFSALAAGTIGLITSQLLRQIRDFPVKLALKESWNNGRWALGGVIVTWLQSQGYTVLLSVLATTASIAEANAARLFLAPVGIISTSLSQVFMPRLALLKNDNQHRKVRSLAAKILFMVIATIFLIVAGVYLLKDFIINLLFSKEYTHIGPLVFLWAVVFVLQAARSNTSMLLQIYKRFRVITLCNAITAALTMVSGWLLIKEYGVSGSILAIALGELVLSLLLWKFFYAKKYSNY